MKPETICGPQYFVLGYLICCEDTWYGRAHLFDEKLNYIGYYINKKEAEQVINNELWNKKLEDIMKTLSVVGKTEDGKSVVSGVFEFSDTYGLPPADLFNLLKQNNMVPCWVSYVQSATECGWKSKTIHAKLREAVVDSYGSSFWVNMEPKLLTLI